MVLRCARAGAPLLLYLHKYFVGLVLAKPSQNKLICLYVLSVDVV